jgi:hypothetical protein
VQGGVDVGAPDGLDEGAGDVVVLVSGAVIPDRRDVERALGVFELDPDRSRPGGYHPLCVVRITVGDAGRGFQGGQRPPGVPAGEPDKVREGLGAEFDIAAQAADIRRGAQQQAFDVRVGERFQGQEQRPGEQRGDDGK